MLVEFDNGLLRAINICLLTCLHRVVYDDIDRKIASHFQHLPPGNLMFLMVDQHLSQTWHHQGEDVLITITKSP